MARITRLTLLFAWVPLLSAPASALPEEAQTCLACHGEAAVAPRPSLEHFDTSSHKGLSCSACHAGASEVPHAVPAIRADCAVCHEAPVQAMRASAHGRAILGTSASVGATCATCHGEPHAVLPAADAASPIGRRNQPASCGACHGDPAKVSARMVGKLESYLQTIHGEALRKGNGKAASCADCHGSHDIRPSGERASKLEKRAIPATCGACHVKEAADFRASIHGGALGRGIREAPSCTDCHGEHTIRPPKDPASKVAAGAVTKTCAACHAQEVVAEKFGLPLDRVQTFMDSFHGLAGRSGDLKAANCASCHGWHEVLPSSDPKSRVHPSNLAQTCGQCHPGAGARLASSRIHVSLSSSGAGSSVAGFFRALYLILIPLIVGGMLVHNGADLLRKTLSRPHLPPLRDEAGVLLLTVSERFQHAALVVSFVLLAWSGFALKFSDSWWNWPLFLLGGEEPRRTFHRAAALLFVAVGVYHAAYLVFTHKGRERLRALLPAGRDFSDPARLFLFNLGLGEKRPALARFSYIEKSEYWGLVWGSVVMVLTGAILLFHNFALAHFPLWVLETCRVIHYMEAVLACLSIVVWHLYWVIYDPDVYPMNWAWLTGRSELRGRKGGPDES